ncbi:MAG: glycosyltransferase family 4 protein, partial [Chloroflexi bacterium]|nr:glycosyltransferase family 4 protein [Chloroflexota bacterium]
MRIGLDARITHYTHGGISAYVRNLAAALPALDAANDYIIFHSRQARESLAFPAHANARRANCWTPAHHRFERAALGLELLPHRLDLLHSPDFIPPLGNFRSIITIHDLTFLRYPQFLTADSRRYYNDQIRFAVQRADAILADSDATRADIIDLLGTPPRKITTVHLAPDTIFRSLPVSQVDAVLHRLNLRTGYVLFVGTFEPRKNIVGLITAYAILPPDSPPLVIAGNKGWFLDDVHKIVRALDLTSRVIFL